MSLLLNHHQTDEIDRALRPTKFDEFIGQPELIERLKIAIEAAKNRDEPVDHCLISGFAGGGKSTIATIIANESETNSRTFFAQTIKKIGDLAEILTKNKDRDVVFIDEIHALDHSIGEVLHSAMEDYKLNIKLGNKEIVTINIKPFTLVGATTLPGKIPQPLRDRFGINYTMQFYSNEELAQIVSANAVKLKLDMVDDEAVMALAKRSRGVPRIANKLLRRVRDYAEVKHNGIVNCDVVKEAMDLEGIDETGISSVDTKYLKTLYEVYNCGPVGMKPLAASSGEDESTINQYVEPYLVRTGFVALTSRGRMLTNKGMEYVINRK